MNTSGHFLSESRTLTLGAQGRISNPSIIKLEDTFLVAYNSIFGSGGPRSASCEIRMAVLDPELNLVNDWALELPSTLSTKDMRLFLHDGELHGVYFEGTLRDPEAGLVVVRFSDNLTVKESFRPTFGRSRRYEKNWQFFSHMGCLMCVYKIRPHVILKCVNGFMSEVCTTEWGEDGQPQLLGGTPPITLDGEYLSFFHSWKPWLKRGIFSSKFLIHPVFAVLNRLIGWPFVGAGTWPHRIYSFGAYTFEVDPPFRVLRYTRQLIIAPTVDAWSGLPACVFPCGACWHSDIIMLSYGYHDRECRLGAYSTEFLRRALGPA